MAVAVTRGGTPWTPQYVEGINHNVCIGGGGCFMGPPRLVLTLADGGQYDAVDEDDWDDEDAKAMMTVHNPMDCIGCGACGRTCPKGCFSFVAA